jgi:SAM-dependent methyltransferase
MNVVEVGGGLSGFQFVLCQTGCQVINVDPGIDGVAPGWACDHASMRRLNRAFGTSVELRRCTMGNAGLEPDSFDRAFSLSVLEHLPEAEAAEVLRGVHDCLKPGGLFVLTIDLFLDLKPFTALTCNRYGTNVDVSSLLRFAPFDRILGRPEELYGFPEFDAQRVLEQVDTLVVGRRHPVLVQCLILQKKKGRARDA